VLCSVVLAVPLGIAAAVWRDRWVDHVSRLIAVVGVAMPVFWLGLLGIYFLFYRWHWLPAPQGRLNPYLTAPKNITGFYSIDSLLAGNWAAFRSSITLLI